MLAYMISFRLEFFISNDLPGLAVLMIQTVFYAVTLPYFLKFVKEKFIYILRNVDNRTMNSILILSFLWFFLIVLINYSFIEGSTFFLALLITLIFIFNVTLTYQLFFLLVMIKRDAMLLTERTKEDALTKSGNRERLYEDVLDKIENNRPFFIVFIDLDRFKSINDNHGHSTGDAYLIDFVESVKKMFNNSDCLYRLSGDEFVYLFEGNEIESFLEKLENIKFIRNKSGVPFLGIKPWVFFISSGWQ